MKTTEPLTIERLYELCEQVKISPTDRDIAISREELWALVEIAKQDYFSKQSCKESGT